MKTSSSTNSQTLRTAIEKLFDEKPPVLVEVRFPGMGTSPDWFLCEDLAALDALHDRLDPKVELRLSSVWDLKNPAGAIVVPNKQLR
jgi:hypothetical protein